MRLTRTPLVAAIAVAVVAAAFVASSALASKAPIKPTTPASHAATAHASQTPTAHTSQAGLEVGVADENPSVFESSYYKALKLKISRYFLPYDIAASSKEKAQLYYFEVWISRAETEGIQPLVAFYHNFATPTKMPSVATYTKDVKAFLKLFPQVTLLQPWNEVNRGNVRERSGNYDSPTPKQSAQYYLALKKICPTCTIVGLDVLDSTTPAATIDYINAFKKDVGSKNMPKIWGLHNYSDTNHFYDQGTRDVLNDVPGQVWLTETGGLAKLSPSFRFSLSRQKKATSYMFDIADAHSKITRLYVYQFYGAKNEKKASFDAGLMNYKGKPRPAYCVVYEHLLGKKKCPYKTVKN
jgi:hypothetical protein